MPITKNGEVYLTTEEACEFLDTTRPTLNRLAREGKIKKYKQGIARTVYYKQSELESVMDFRPLHEDETE